MIDEDLKEIVISKTDGEVLAVIPSDGEIIQHNDILVRFNYGEPNEYEDVDGKVYVAE